MMQRYDIGEFDVIVQGGGPQGMFEAVRQRQRGQRVLLIESRSCLLWQVARAKQSEPVIAEDFTDAVRHSFLNQLEAYNAIRGGRLDPGFAEIAADQWLLSEGVQVLFMAKLLHSDQGIATIALKGKTGQAAAQRIIDCRESVNSGFRIDGHRHPFSIWTLTLQNVPLRQQEHLELAVCNRSIKARLRQGFYASDTMADIAFPNDHASGMPIEIVFGQELASIVEAIRGHREEWSKAILIHLADEAWIPEGQDRLVHATPDPFWQHISDQFTALFR